MKRITIWLAMTLILLSAAACGGSALPEIEIISPADGQHVVVNEETALNISASDDDGISKIEVFINGALYKSEPSPSGAEPIFNISALWYPPAPGPYNVMAIAYQTDGAASTPVSISVTADGEGAENGGEQLISTPTTEYVPPEEPDAGWVQGEVVVDNSALRVKPGVFCDPVFDLDRGEVINLLEFSKDMNWLATDFDYDPAVDDEISWIWLGNIQILGNEDDIPRGDEVGCLGCGDGICSPEIGEDCSTCEEDCGPCCGNGVCEPGYGEDCSTCEPDCGPCCGNGVCEAGYGEDCATCEVDCGPCCGNGICEFDYGENCYTCEIDCGACCGDGVCDPVFGEDCATCEIDCGPCCYCGDGICQRECGEVYANCPADCIG